MDLFAVVFGIHVRYDRHGNESGLQSLMIQETYQSLRRYISLATNSPQIRVLPAQFQLKTAK